MSDSVFFKPSDSPTWSCVRVAEINMPWLPGCDDHVDAHTLRLEMVWDGVRGTRKGEYAHHVDICGGCGRPINRKIRP